MHYIEIQLFPGDDINLNHLWGYVFQQIHYSLVSMKDQNDLVSIGLDWPDYSDTLHTMGSKLRLFSMSKDVLEKWKSMDCLCRFGEYVFETGIRDVPQSVTEYYSYWRKREKRNPERIARRMVKRQNISFEDAMAHLKERSIDEATLPYITIKSDTTGQRFPLRITKEKASLSGDFSFNTYGLSTVCAVPSF